MTFNATRDTAIADDAAAAFELYTRLIASGYTTTGGSWSDATTRVGNAGPASAANLSATNSYFIVRWPSGWWLSVKRTAAGSWLVEWTSSDGTMAGGTNTVPDRDATYTKIWLSSAQFYPTTGTTTTKAHTVVDTVTGSFVMVLRRSPFVGGNTDGCSCIFLDVVTPLTWVGNPSPQIGGAVFNNSNVVMAGSVFSGVWGWYKKGIVGASYVNTWTLENPGTVFNAGGAADPSGSDLNVDVRWVTAGSYQILGVSTIFKGLSPYRTPIGGISAGTDWTRAAFGGVSVANDGSALTT